MSQISAVPKQVLKEAIRTRKVAAREFLPFCKYVDPKHPVETRHIRYMGAKLEQVARYIETKGQEGIGRLMIFMPPRYWKSQTASRKFPAWILGRNPNLRIILTSYGADLATKHSREVRDLIMSDRYQTVFGQMASVDEPVLLDADSRSSAAWDVAGNPGGMIAAGVGGAITGFGANLFIIDDPVKSREDAASEARRESVYEWYRSTAFTRLEDHAAIVLIMTRWDQEDLAGKLLTAMISDPEADQWEVVFMPALALEANHYPRNDDDYTENLLRGIYVPRENDQLGRAYGEPLWPEKHDEQQLKIIAANMGDFEFTAQFGQMPRLAAGEYLDDRDFQIIEKAPEGLQWFWYCDLALGEKQTSDFNVTGGVAFDEQGNQYVRDRVKERELDRFLVEVRALMLSDAERGSTWGIEDVAFQKLIVKQFLEDRALVNVDIRGVKPMGDKVERSRPWRRRAKQGKLFLVRGRWNQDFIRNATSFPRGRHDDDVDMVSGGTQMQAEEGGYEGRTAASEAVVVDMQSLFSNQLSVSSNQLPVTSDQWPLDMRR